MGERGSLNFCGLWFFFHKLVPTIACPGATAWHYRMLGSLGEGSVNFTTVLCFGDYFLLSNSSYTNS